VEVEGRQARSRRGCRAPRAAARSPPPRPSCADQRLLSPPEPPPRPSCADQRLSSPPGRGVVVVARHGDGARCWRVFSTSKYIKKTMRAPFPRARKHTRRIAPSGLASVSGVHARKAPTSACAIADSRGSQRGSSDKPVPRTRPSDPDYHISNKEEAHARTLDAHSVAVRRRASCFRNKRSPATSSPPQVACSFSNTWLLETRVSPCRPII
jgi:hypothetical protein